MSLTWNLLLRNLVLVADVGLFHSFLVASVAWDFSLLWFEHLEYNL